MALDSSCSTRAASTLTAAAAAFDRHAENYDSTVRNEIFDWIRGRFMARLLLRFEPGARLLEIGCGTGRDLAVLTEMGYRVAACDPAPAMVETSRERLRRVSGAAALLHASDESRLSRSAAPLHEGDGRMSGAGEANRPLILNCGLDELDAELEISGEPARSFDGIYSNFGALNCVKRLDGLRHLADKRLKSGGSIVISSIGPFCAAETLGFLAALEFKRAFRRLGDAARQVDVAGIPIAITYHRPREIAAALGGSFQLQAIVGAGVFMPPPELASRWRRVPRAVRRAAESAEKSLAAHFPFNRCGDHQIVEFRRL